MANSKRFNFWIDEDNLDSLKSKAKKENRSVANIINCELFTKPKKKRGGEKK